MIYVYGPIYIYKCSVLYMRVGWTQTDTFFIAWTFIMLMHAFILFPCKVTALRSEHGDKSQTIIYQKSLPNEFHWHQHNGKWSFLVPERYVAFALVLVKQHTESNHKLNLI